MSSTKLLYLEDFSLLFCDAKIVDLFEENGQSVILLDQTIFYPQGGGQPYDKGFIDNLSGKFSVEEVRFFDGVVKHVGRFESGQFQVGMIVKCLVDESRRLLNSRIHSAGHVVDMAISALRLNWIPGKGYQFPEGPYVEYAGSIDGLDKEKLKIDIENLCNKFVEENRETKILFMDKSEMNKICSFVPDYISEDKQARVVMFEDFGVPCGGTHVKNLAEIRHMTIRKIKVTGQNVRISYDVLR